MYELFFFILRKLLYNKFTIANNLNLNNSHHTNLHLTLT